MVEIKKQNSVIFSSLICILLFYSGLIPVGNKNGTVTLIDKSRINVIQGKITSSPIKSSKGDFYSANLRLSFIQDSKKIISSSSGIIKILVPSESVEAYYPGKLYSSSIQKGAFICEKGVNVKLYGNFKNDYFIAKKSFDLGFDTSFHGKITTFRALCRLQFKRLMYSWGDAGGLLLALLSGSKEYTNDDVSKSFQNAGLSHILALSGMHLSLFSGIAVFIGNRIGNKKLTLIIRLIFLILFVWFAGFSPSLLRAFICSSLLLLQITSSSEKVDMLSILAFSFLLQIIISPNDLHNIGFILSYGSLVGILIANNFFRFIYSRFMPHKLSLSFASSSSAQLTSIPLSLKIFGSFNPLGVVASTIVSPLITIFIYSGLILIVFCLIFPYFTNPCGFFIKFQYNLIKKIVFIFSRFPRINI